MTGGAKLAGDDTLGAPPPTALTLDWVPYRCSVVANRVSICLQSMYGERFQLSVPGWRIMFVLGQHAPLSGKEVGERTAMDQVQVTRAVNQMAAVNLISRRVDPSDRRRVILRLSRRGEEAYAEIVPLAQKIQSEILATLDAEEAELFSSLLGRVLSRVEEVLPDDVDWRSFISVPVEPLTKPRTRRTKVGDPPRP